MMRRAPDPERVPTILFDTRRFPVAERQPAAAELAQSLYEISPRGDAARFEVRATGHHVADLVFTVVSFSASFFRRDARHLQASGSDFLVLEAQLSGEQRLIMDVGPLRLLPGHIHLRDWSCGFESEATAMRLFSIVIPRRCLKAGSALGPGNPVITWSMSDSNGHMLLLLWKELLMSMRRLTLTDAEELARAFLGFLDGLLGRHVARAPSSTFTAMQQYLMVKLRSETDVSDLCQHFHVSRSTVYRLFEPVGGVRKFLNAARLERCRVELSHSNADRTRVADVAASWGFSDRSSFSRSFRKRFGAPPSALVGTARLADLPQHIRTRTGSSFRDYREYMAWFNEAAGWDDQTRPHMPTIPLTRS